MGQEAGREHRCSKSQGLAVCRRDPILQPWCGLMANGSGSPGTDEATVLNGYHNQFHHFKTRGGPILVSVDNLQFHTHKVTSATATLAPKGSKINGVNT